MAVSISLYFRHLWLNEDFGRIECIIVNADVGQRHRVGTGKFEINGRTVQINFILALARCEAAMQNFLAQNQR